MSEMVERVAQALADAEYRSYDGDANHYEMARAAIAAMREPTDDMICAAKDEDMAWNVGDVWRAMIDEALADEPAA
jgi:hypothetical protein